MKQPTLRDEIARILVEDTGTHNFEVESATNQIIDLLLSELPENKYVSEDEDPAKAYDDLVHQGYNQAIEEITKIIKEI